MNDATKTEIETETETARYDFEEQGPRGHEDARIKVRRNGVAIGGIYKAFGCQPVAKHPYEVTLLGSRVTFDASVIKAYQADHYVEDGVIELRSESLDGLKRFVEEVVTGFAKPVSTTVVDGDNVYLVRRVNPGNEYGVKLRNRPPLVADKVLIEFYVKETPGYSWDKLEEIHGPLGYFVSRYQWAALHFSRGDSEILDLGGYTISREKVSGALDSLYALNLHVNAP